MAFFVNFRWISTFSSEGKSQVGVKQGVNIGILIEFFSFFSIRFDHDTWHTSMLKNVQSKIALYDHVCFEKPNYVAVIFQNQLCLLYYTYGFFDKLQIKTSHAIQCFYYPASLFLSVKDLNFQT